jgi:hypothetical protein
MKKIILFLLLLIGFCNACKKETITPSPWIDDDKIFVSGAISPNKACYWTKDKTVEIDNPNIVSNTKKVVYANNTMYVAGSSEVNGKQQACFWYNTGFYLLPSDNYESIATDICIDGENIYVCGYVTLNDVQKHTKACFWKNGVLQYLDAGATSSDAVAMAMQNGDVFIAGHTFTNYHTGVVWKNGDAVINLPIESGTFVKIKDIAINSAGEPVTVGSRYFSNGGLQKLRYWVNDVENFINNSQLLGGEVNSICITNTNGLEDLHFVGGTGGNYGNAFYYKNNQRITLDKKGDYSDAMDIKVQNGISYIIGYSAGPCIWKNGIGKTDLNADGSNSKLYISSIWVNP